MLATSLASLFFFKSLCLYVFIIIKWRRSSRKGPGSSGQGRGHRKACLIPLTGKAGEGAVTRRRKAGVDAIGRRTHFRVGYPLRVTSLLQSYQSCGRIVAARKRPVMRWACGRRDGGAGFYPSGDIGSLLLGSGSDNRQKVGSRIRPKHTVIGYLLSPLGGSNQPPPSTKYLVSAPRSSPDCT